MHTWQSTPVPRVPGTPRPLRLFDTAAREIRPTTPGPTATMYVCGITPYDAAHLGHAATYLTFDLVHRLWLDNGHDVDYVQNVTDVDDPLLERAERDRIDWVALAERETTLYRADMTALRVLPPSELVGAVEAIPEIVESTAKLVADGLAYRVDDARYPDIYYDHAATRELRARFGSVSSYDEPTMMTLFAERGGDPDRPGKRHPLDPLLWRAARPGEPSWDGELGPGRPGWHIECSVIALNRLGLGFDLQGGGTDLIFPHHEFSAAHGEALTSQHPFARHYTHAGMINLDGAKMSKSRGNLVFVSKLREQRVDPMAIRISLLDGHYRDDRPWSADLLDRGVARLRRWRAALDAPAGPDALPTVRRLRDHLADDLDTVRALAAVDAWVQETTTLGGSSATAPAELRTAVDALLGIAV